jgi:hypothetical protein
MKPPIIASLLLASVFVPIVRAEEFPVVIVRTAEELKDALRNPAPGTTIRIAPGEYPGGWSAANVSSLTVEALDPNAKPIFRGGTTGWHFSRCDGLILRNLVIIGQTENGLNIDDGGQRERSIPGVWIERVEVRDIGPRGNHDGIKLSGLRGLNVRDCKIEGWGGEGIDMVGCRFVAVIGCELSGKDGFSASAGIQMKGGCTQIVVEKCRFIHAGERPVNMGGSTGMDYFRPPAAHYEAAGITVRKCLFEGSSCAAAFVGLDGGEFYENTILYPEKWIFRILQETRAEGFAPCRNVIIRENRIVFRRSQVAVEVNIGPGTAPDTFQFARNQWFAEDHPSASKPKLPVAESGGTYGTDPR